MNCSPPGGGEVEVPATGPVRGRGGGIPGHRPRPGGGEQAVTVTDPVRGREGRGQSQQQAPSGGRGAGSHSHRPRPGEGRRGAVAATGPVQGGEERRGQSRLQTQIIVQPHRGGGGPVNV